MSSTPLLIGLDAGASKTLLLAQKPGVVDPVERRGPGANPNQVGRKDAAAVLARLAEAVLEETSSVSTVSLCAGVAGAGRPEEQQALANALRDVLRRPSLSVQVEVVHDGVIAMDAAYDAGSGIIVIAGTGSVVLGRTTEGDLLRTGGWGHVLGDAGSGRAIGQAGLRAVAETFDGGSDTTLQGRVRDHCGIDDRESLLRKVYQDDLVIQGIAPLVIEAADDGDAVASDILRSQVDQLVEQVGWLLNRAGAITPRITLLGGMLRNERYETCLRRRLQDRFPDWSVEVLQDEPVVGALRRARRLQSPERT